MTSALSDALSETQGFSRGSSSYRGVTAHPSESKASHVILLPWSDSCPTFAFAEAV